MLIIKKKSEATFLLLIFLSIMLITSTPLLAQKPEAKPTPRQFTKFPVLEYHLIGRPEGRWQRTPENFRGDLAWLYQNNYYPVNLRDLLNGFKDLPPGKRPVVLTFDDSSRGQFNYLPDGRLDPDSAVGILKEFYERHPKEWPLRATFFVLIETNEPSHNLFGQPELAAKKLRQLTEWGMEIGSHTYSHDRLDRLSVAAAKKTLERSRQAIGKITGQEVVSLALPLGKYPRDRSVLADFKLAAEVAGGMNPMKFDPLRIKRIQALDSEWAIYLKRIIK